MSNSFTGADILKGTLQKAGELADGSSIYEELALKFINNFYLDLLSSSSMFDIDIGDPFPWALSSTPLVVILRKAYETGTVALTSGSSAGVFSTPPSASLGSFVNRHIKMSEDFGEYYRITAHTAGSANFTLDTEFLGDTGNFNFKAHKLIYDLGSNILRLVEPFRVYQERGFNMDCDEDLMIQGLEAATLRSDFPLTRLVLAIPTRFAPIYQNDDSYLIQMNASVLEDMKADGDYVPLPTSIINSQESIPVIPREHRSILEHGAAHLLSVEKGMSEKAQYYLGTTKALLNTLIRSKNKTMRNTSKVRGRLIPRDDRVRAFRFRGYW